MASHSLLDLVCQLQNFETKISEIVMEMTTKLCSLNDTKLILMLSTSTGRKVIGDPDICQQFFQHRLTTDGTESYLAFDPLRNAMVEVPLMPTEPNLPVFPGTISGGGSRKRMSTDSFASDDRSKSPRLSLDSYGNHGSGGGVDGRIDAWISDDVECCVIDVEEDEKPATSSSSFHDESNQHQQQAPNNDRIVARINPAKSSNVRIKWRSDFKISEELKSKMNNFFEKNPYAHAFVECDGFNVVSRDTKEHKVLTSLIMQFSKFCSPNCPPDKPDKQAFANQSFDIFWQNFPNLHEVESLVINNGHQNYSVKSYCKTRFSGRMYSITSRGQHKKSEMEDKTGLHQF